MDTDYKKFKRKLQAENKAIAFRLLNSLWPGFKNMPSLRNYVKQLASDINFNEKWFVEKIDRRVGRHVRNGGVYQPVKKERHYQFNELSKKTIRTELSTDFRLSLELERERKNNIDAGIPYPNMSHEEQSRLRLALQKKSSRSDASLKRPSNDDLSERSKRLTGHIGHLTNTNIRLWLASLPDTDRADFASWCARQGIHPVQKHWESFVQSSIFQLAEYSIPDYSAVKNKLRKAGWTEDELTTIGNGRLYKEYLAENTRQKLDVPHFDKRKAAASHGFTLVKVRTSQGLFRADVLRNWGESCAITGTKLALEAAHILSHKKGGAPSVENGICLAADLHTLLDRGHLKIVNGRVKLSDEAREDERYASLEGSLLRQSLVEVHFPSD